jgi:hypothetical protein
MKMPRRYAFGIESSFKFGEAGDTLRKFLFSYEGDIVREFKGYNVFWLRGLVRILGISVGCGVFLRFSEIENPDTNAGA